MPAPRIHAFLSIPLFCFVLISANILNIFNFVGDALVITLSLKSKVNFRLISEVHSIPYIEAAANRHWLLLYLSFTYRTCLNILLDQSMPKAE